MSSSGLSSGGFRKAKTPQNAKTLQTPDVTFAEQKRQRGTSMTRLAVIPMMAGRSVPDHLRLNRDFIRQCHEDNMHAVDIAAALGLTMSKTVVYAAFSDYKVGRSHMGFDPILEVRRRERIAALEAFKSRAKPQEKRSSLEHVLNNRALIIELHHFNAVQSEIAKIISANPCTLNNNLHKSGLSRKAFGLKPISGGPSKQVYKPQVERQWRDKDEVHIRRGHACQFPLTAIGALCRRSGLEIQEKAKEMGLGSWRVEPDPRRRQAMARDYDAQTDLSLLAGDEMRESTHKGLSPDASYLK